MADDRPANPKINDVWVTSAGVLEYYTGTAWLPYLSPPETGPDSVFQPGMLEEEAADSEESGEDDSPGGTEEAGAPLAPDETSGES